jgi:orotidine-5'-phosphate decarboxylase
VARVNVTPIVAIDVADPGRAAELVSALGNDCAFYKVGSELFTSAGRRAVDVVRNAGKQVFLDLKFHDIPNTVGAACRESSAMGASMVTVHAAGGPRMIAAAVEGAGPECGVLAVTVLTSIDAAELESILGRPVGSMADEVSRLASMARESGAHGVVCSGHEAARLRSENGAGFALLVPGIRLAGGAQHDQKRVMTPSQAAAAGATHLVIGRAVTGAADPVRAMRAVLADLGGAGGSSPRVGLH